MELRKQGIVLPFVAIAIAALVLLQTTCDGVHGDDRLHYHAYEWFLAWSITCLAPIGLV